MHVSVSTEAPGRRMWRLGGNASSPGMWGEGGKSCLEAGACHVHCPHSLAVTLRILTFNLTGIRRL